MIEKIMNFIKQGQARRYQREVKKCCNIIDEYTKNNKLYASDEIKFPPYVREKVIYDVIEDQYKKRITYLKATFTNLPLIYSLINRPSHTIKITDPNWK